MYLLDTNHCTGIIANQSTILRRVAQVGEQNVVTCVTVRGELIYMAHNSEPVAENLTRVQSFLADIRVYPIDERTADLYGALKGAVMQHFGPKERSKRRHVTMQQLGIGDNDLWIAAVALQHGLTVVSVDADFVRLQQVRPFPLESWLAL